MSEDERLELLDKLRYKMIVFLAAWGSLAVWLLLWGVLLGWIPVAVLALSMDARWPH